MFSSVVPFPYLKHYACGLIKFYYLIDDWLEEMFITFKREDITWMLHCIFHTVQGNSNAKGKPSTHFGHQCHHAKGRSDSNSGHSQLQLHTCRLAVEKRPRAGFCSFFKKAQSQSLSCWSHPQPEEILSPFLATHWHTITAVCLSH